MIVDTHLHVVSDDDIRYPKLGKGPAEQPKWPAFTEEMLIRDLDEAGVDRALTVQGFHTYLFDNTYAIDVARHHPKRLQSVVVIDQRLPDAPDLMSDLVENHGVRGVRMMKVRDGIYSDPQTFPLWQRLQALKIPVCLNKAGPEQISEICTMLEKFPEVQLALDHSWAGPLDSADPPYSCFKEMMELSRYPNLFLKVAPNLTYDLIDRKGDSKRFWSMVVEHFGANRVMWGSNYPAHWHLYGKIKPRLDIMRKELAFLSENDQKWIFGESALRLWPSLR